MTKIRSFKFVSFVKKFLHFKCIHLYNAIKILTLSLIRKVNMFLHIKLIQILTSKTSLILSRKNTEFHGKKCTGRLLHFHITLNVQIVSRIFSFQNYFIVYNIKKKIWNSLERTSNFINVARRTKNDSPWFLKFLDVRLKCINIKKQRSLNKLWCVNISALRSFWRKEKKTSSSKQWIIKSKFNRTSDLITLLTVMNLKKSIFHLQGKAKL